MDPKRLTKEKLAKMDFDDMPYWNEDGLAEYQITYYAHGNFGIDGYARDENEATEKHRQCWREYGNAEIRKRGNWIINR